MRESISPETSKAIRSRKHYIVKSTVTKLQLNKGYIPLLCKFSVWVLEENGILSVRFEACWWMAVSCCSTHGIFTISTQWVHKVGGRLKWKCKWVKSSTQHQLGSKRQLQFWGVQTNINDISKASWNCLPPVKHKCLWLGKKLLFQCL